LRLQLPTDFRLLHFTREVDDGTLNVVTRELRERETKQELHELVNHAMEDFRDPVWNGDKWVAGTLFQTVRPVLKEPVPGCEAVDVVMDARPSDVATSTTRMYVLWMRPKSRATITTVVYENLIGTFAPAIDDVLGLVERWSCK